MPTNQQAQELADKLNKECADIVRQYYKSPPGKAN